MVSEVETRFEDILAQLDPDAKLVSHERLMGGVSADVFKLNTHDGSVVLRIHGATHSGHPAQLEFDTLKALYDAGLPVAQPLAVDTSGGVIDEPYLFMRFIEGSTAIPRGEENQRIEAMAQTLARVHASSTANLPKLPLRLDPLPEVFEFLPENSETLSAHLASLSDTAYQETPKLLHGDFWPENILWQDAKVAAVLDWEDAALGDPLSDVASARIELRYLYGTEGMQRFSDSYAQLLEIDQQRLLIWQIYVASAAYTYMHLWRLEAKREAHMRKECLASIHEAAQQLFG